MNRAGVVVERSKINRVFPCKPRMRGRLERNEYLSELFSRRDFLEYAEFPSKCLSNIFIVALNEAVSIKFVQIRRFLRVKHIPVGAGTHSAHEFIGEKDRRVCRAHAKIIVACVVLPIQKLREIIVPILHIETERSLLLSAALNRPYGGINDFREWGWAA